VLVAIDFSPLEAKYRSVDGGPGRPPYHPRVLAALWIYGMTQGRVSDTSGASIAPAERMAVVAAAGWGAEQRLRPVAKRPSAELGNPHRRRQPGWQAVGTQRAHDRLAATCGRRQVWCACAPLRLEQLPLGLPCTRGRVQLAEGASHRASLEVGWIPGGR
jgi:hypothetical protein